jgi:glycosyltransferase involved in cell wall biosynthesis
LKIVIDARMYGPKRWTGIGRYLQHLLAELEQLDADNEYVVLVGRENWNDYEPKHKNFHKILAPALPYSPTEQLSLVRQLWALQPDVVHFAAPNAPLLYFGRRVTTVHDLTLLRYSTARGEGLQRWLHDAKKLPFRLVLWWGVRCSRVILTPTNYVKHQLVERYNVPASHVTVTPEAIEAPVGDSGSSTAADAMLARLGLMPDGYLLFVGNCYPYKNVDRLVDAFTEVAAGGPGLKLVLVGRDDYFRDLLRQRVADLKLGERIVFTGAVSDEDLSGLYHGARLYVNPSLSEGFGLQGLEAMMAGVPVLSARASCLPEVYGDAAEYFEPTNTADLVKKMTTLLGDDRSRLTFVKRGRERVKEFSWRRMAEATLAAYRSTTGAGRK